MLLRSIKYYVIGCVLLFLFISCSDIKETKQKLAVSVIDTANFYPANSTDTLQAIYDSTLSYLWRNFVPESGQSNTVQGELARIIERLEYEIAGNAKANWDTPFVLLGKYLRDTLIQSGLFPKNIEEEIYNDVNTLIRDEDEVGTEDYYYDRLKRRIVEWYWRNKTPRRHTFNPAVYR